MKLSLWDIGVLSIIIVQPYRPLCLIKVGIFLAENFSYQSETGIPDFMYFGSFYFSFLCKGKRAESQTLQMSSGWQKKYGFASD